MKKLSQTQKAAIYCVKHGHAKYVDTCCGEVYCGRCGDKIGDTLAGVFDLSDRLLVGCKKGKRCKVCPAVVKSLSKMDRLILSRLKRYDGVGDMEKVLKGVRIPV